MVKYRRMYSKAAMIVLGYLESRCKDGQEVERSPKLTMRHIVQVVSKGNRMPSFKHNCLGETVLGNWVFKGVLLLR